MWVRNSEINSAEMKRLYNRVVAEINRLISLARIMYDLGFPNQDSINFWRFFMGKKDISRFSINLFFGIMVLGLSVPVWIYLRIIGLFYLENVSQWIQTPLIFIIVCIVALLIGRILMRIAGAFALSSPYGKESSKGERTLRFVINVILIIVSIGVLIIIGAYYYAYLSSWTTIPFDQAVLSPPSSSLLYWFMVRRESKE